MVEDTGEKSRQWQVWAGTYDPRSSDVVRNVEASLVHRMMDPGVLTPGEKFNRDRDRDSFRKALGNLNDGLSDLCHGMLQRVEMYEDDSWPPEMNMPYPASSRSARSSNLSKAQSARRDPTAGSGAPVSEHNHPSASSRPSLPSKQSKRQEQA